MPTIVAFGETSGLQTRMRSDERGVKLADFHVTLAAKCLSHAQRGGCDMGFGLRLPQPHSSICLIPLWLTALKRPSRFGRGRKAGT